MKPILDPCFSEYEMKFVCGHTKTLFKSKYKLEDQYCEDESCKAMREVENFRFVGVKPNKLDRKRSPHNIEIQLKEWDVEAKHGIYYLRKPWRMKNGKYIARDDDIQAPNFGEFSDAEKESIKKSNESKYAEKATANYNDQKALTVFEVPDWALLVPEKVTFLLQYLQLPDVIAYTVRASKKKRGDGTYRWKRVSGKPIDPARLVIPAHQTV
jgi:hypothetical protein